MSLVPSVISIHAIVQTDLLEASLLIPYIGYRTLSSLGQKDVALLTFLLAIILFNNTLHPTSTFWITSSTYTILSTAFFHNRSLFFLETTPISVLRVQ